MTLVDLPTGGKGDCSVFQRSVGGVYSLVYAPTPECRQGVQARIVHPSLGTQALDVAWPILSPRSTVSPPPQNGTVPFPAVDGLCVGRILSSDLIGAYRF